MPTAKECHTKILFSLVLISMSEHFIGRAPFVKEVCIVFSIRKMFENNGMAVRKFYSLITYPYEARETR